jgi:hypothetical protein
VARTKEHPDRIVTMAEQGQIKVEQGQIKVEQGQIKVERGQIKGLAVQTRERIRVIRSLAITFEDSTVKSFKRGPCTGVPLP